MDQSNSDSISVDNSEESFFSTVPDNNPDTRFSKPQIDGNRIINARNTNKTTVLLIHRVFIVFFVRHLRRSNLFRKATFLRNNVNIKPGTFDKFEHSKEVIKKLNELETKYGPDFLLRDESVAWITKGTFIKLGEIPKDIMKKYTDEPYRSRAKRVLAKSR